MFASIMHLTFVNDFFRDIFKRCSLFSIPYTWKGRNVIKPIVVELYWCFLAISGNKDENLSSQMRKKIRQRGVITAHWHSHTGLCNVTWPVYERVSSEQKLSSIFVRYSKKTTFWHMRTIPSFNSMWCSNKRRLPINYFFCLGACTIKLASLQTWTTLKWTLLKVITPERVFCVEWLKHDVVDSIWHTT